MKLTAAHLDALQESCEKWTELYIQYSEGASQRLPQQRAKSACLTDGFTGCRAHAVRGR